MPPAALPAAARRAAHSRRALRLALAVAAGASAAAGLAAVVWLRLRRARRERWAREQLARWCEKGPAKEPIVECEVPVAQGFDGEDAEQDAVEVPVGLLFECGRLLAALREALGAADGASDDAALVELFGRRLAAAEEEGADDAREGTEAASPLVLRLPWVDLAALAQLTYWYDRRPRGEQEEAWAGPVAVAKEARLSDARFGRWTKKVSREKVIYGTVALRYRARGHLGATAFRRPAGVDVTRLRTLRRAAALCSHGPLLELVEATMEQLRPRNVARIPWAEVRKHTSRTDLWLLIDSKVYDVTPFIDLHPGGGQLIVDAAGKDATSLFELTHGEGLRYSLRLLNQFFIGDCDDAAQAEPAEPGQPTSEFLRVLRSITGALHTFDEARATGEAHGFLK